MVTATIVRFMKFASPFALSMILFACFSAPQPQPAAPFLVSSEAVQSYQQADTDVEINLAPSVLETQFREVRLQSGIDNINEVLAKYIVILRGDLSQTPALPLSFNPSCTGRYEVTNPNVTHTVLTWRSESLGTRGSLIAAGSTTTSFEAPGSNIGVYLGATRLTVVNPVATPCTNALPSVPGALTIAVTRIGNQIRVRLPGELLPGDRFTLFLNVTPPFAFSATRVLTRDEQREQSALKTAWNLVANDPRITGLGLDLNTSFIRGIQYQGGLFMIVPDNDLGYVQLAVRDGKVMTLERWAFFDDGTVAAWNLLNGLRSDIGSLDELRGAKTDPVKRARFLAAYEKLYDPGTEERMVTTFNNQVVPLAVGCTKCDDKLDAVRSQVRVLVEARATVSVDVIDSAVGCLLGGIKGCFTELFSNVVGYFASRGNVESLIAAFNADQTLQLRLADLRTCQASLNKACYGGFAIFAKPPEVSGFTGDYATIAVELLNSADYARVIDVFIEGQPVPATTITLLGGGRSKKPLRYLCQLVQRIGRKLIGVDTAPGNIPPEYRRAETTVVFDCEGLPELRFTNQDNPLYNGNVSSGGNFGLQAKLSRGGQQGNSFELAERLKSISQAGFTWSFTNAVVLGDCQASDLPGVLVTKTGDVVEESLGTVFKLTNTFTAKLKNNCDQRVNVNIRSKENPAIAVRTPLPLTVKKIQISIFQDAYQFTLDPGQTFLLPTPKIEYDASNSGYKWDAPDDPRQKITDNKYLTISRDTAIGTFVEAKVRSVANPAQVESIKFIIKNSLKVAATGQPYHGPNQNCARVLTSASSCGQITNP